MNTKSAVPSVKRPNIVAVGTIVWLGSEVMFFAGLFAIYFTLRAMNPELWAEQTAKHNFTFAADQYPDPGRLILHGPVSASSPPRNGRPRSEAVASGERSSGSSSPSFIGAIFVSGQVYEYATFVSEGITLGSDPYGSAFYMTTGFHGIHVALGLVAFLLVIGRLYAVKNFTHKEETTAIVVSYYWHFVDIVWIILFIIIYVLK